MIIKLIIFVTVPPSGATVTINALSVVMAVPFQLDGKSIWTPASAFVYVPLTSVIPGIVCPLASPKENKSEKKAADRSAATKTECLCFIALKLTDLIFKQI